jgi:hypothetical protein
MENRMRVLGSKAERLAAVANTTLLERCGRRMPMTIYVASETGNDEGCRKEIAHDDDDGNNEKGGQRLAKD